MKKVVLLASAVAAGMAIAPQAANAAAPEINDIQEIQSEDDVRRLMIEMDAELGSLEAFQLQPEYAKANVSFRDALTTVIGHMRELRRECDKMVDDLNNNSDYFVEKYDGHDSDHIGNFNAKANGTNDYADWVGDYMQGITISTGGCFSNVTKVFENQQKVAKKACSDIIKSVNANVEAAIVSNPDYTHLVAIKNAAKAIVDGNNNYYTDAYTDAVYSDIIDAELTAHFVGAIESVDNFIAKVAGASEVTNQFVDQHALETQLVTLRPELEGLLLNFKEKANEAAYKEIEKYVDGYLHEDATTSESDGTLIKKIKKLTHHLANTATCFDKTSSDLLVHDILKETKVASGINELKLYIATLNNEWDALNSAIHTPLASDKVLYGNQEPPSVNLWYQIKNIPGNKVDTDLKTIESNAYKACLTYDLQDIEAALNELDGANYRAALEDGKTAKDETPVASDIKTWLHDHLTNTTQYGTAAKEWKELKDRFNTTYLTTTVDIDEATFNTEEAKVDALEKTIANLKANWADIKSLNDDVLGLKLDMENAKENDGYDSAYIKDQWENATTGELKHYNDLLDDVETAIDNINDVETSWVGKDTFKSDIALENDHHDWLAQYQQENYDAKESLLDAIEVRFAEYEKVANFAITSDDPENPMALADGTELYTTDTNKGVSLIDIFGEETTTKLIYKDAFFDELMEHFGNNDGTVDAASIVTDGKPVDLMEDLIKDWYDKGDAQYIGAKTYVDDKWNDAERKGELKNNTVEGLQVTTSATDASGILVFAPEATTAGNEVVFGWLQKEIQNAFAKAVENEKANKDLHDQIDACEEYVQDAKDDIDNYAKFTLSHLEQKLDVYSLSDRKTSPVTRGNQSWDLDILYPGTTSGVPSLDPVALPAEYKTKEDATVITLAAGAHDYNSDFNCGHESGVWGWAKIATEITALWNLEKQEYDKVASKALLDAKTVENKITEIEENVDDIKNEAYTRIIKNGFARVHNSINEARAWAVLLDDVCHEDVAAKPCSTEDIKNNPCGWDDPVASKALADLIDFYNEKLTLLGTEHSAEKNDDHATPVVDEDNIVEFAGYLNQMYKDLNAWTVKFVAADTKHKKALNAALDLAGEEAHALHHYSYDANQALINYNDAEKAAANLWAVDFSKRKIGTFDGEKVTFQEFVKKIDEKMIAEGAVNHTLDPDVYAAIKKFAAEPIANFQDYINATEKLEGFIKVVAQVYYDHHQYTELKKLADGTKNFNWDADFQKAVDANNATHVELLKQLAQAQATLDAAKNDVIADKNEVYPVDYDALTTTDLKAAQDVLDAQKTNIEKAWKDGKAADYSTNGEEDLNVKGYKLNLKEQDTDEKNVIEVYVDKAQAAKNLYAANKLAKEELLRQVEAALTTLKADYEKADFTGGDQCMSAYKTQYEDLKAEIEALKTSVNNSFDKKFADITGESKTVETLQGDINESIKKLGQLEKNIADYNTKVLASDNAAKNLNNMIKAAFSVDTDADGNLIPVGEKMKEAMVEGYENFQVRPATPAISNTEVKYFNQILDDIDALKAQIATDNGHVTTVDGVEVGGHVVAEKYADYLQAMANIQADLEELVQAIKDNEQAHKAQLKHRDELYKKYECYDTTGLEAAVKFIADPDFSLDTEFPEVPGYPETAVDPAGKDHTKAHTAVAEAIKALDDEIQKHYENGASNMDDAKTKIGEKETAYTTAFQHAQDNDTKFMEEYGNCTEAAKAVGQPAPLNWQADHFENGANKYSDEANVQVTNAYSEMVAAQKAYLADIKTDWYKNEAVEKVADNEGLLNTYKEKITAYKAAVEKAQTNDQEFDKQYAAHVVKPLTAEATYTDTRVTDDPTYVTLKGQLTALYPECNNVETDSKYNTIRKQIIQDWEDEKSALNGTATDVAAYQAAAKKYNELMANLNAYGSQLVKYFEQSDAFDAAQTTIAGYDIMKDGYKTIDGNTEGAQDYDHKKDIVNAISNIDGKLNTLYNDMKTEAEHVAETINDADLTNNEVNDLNVAPAVGTLKTLIENLVKDAKKYEDACDANQAAFEPLHDNIKTVEADYAEDSAKVTALPEPAQEAFNLAVKEDLEALADLQKDLEEAYMDEDAVNFTKDNTDYEDLKKEIEEMYDRAVQAGANLGDIDGVDGITVYDSDALVDIVLYNRGYAVRGDFDFNGENDVTDVERLNNLLWYKHIEKAWAPGRVAFEGDIELTAEGNTVALALNNNVQTNGIQFDVTVPEGAYIQNVLGTDRVEGMRVLTACIADNTYRVLVISTLNASTINGNEGAIVTFNVAGGSEVEVSNVIATDGSSHRLNGAAVSVGVTTDINEVAAEGETDIFSLDGIRQSVMKAGVNIVRGANGVAKKIFNK